MIVRRQLDEYEWRRRRREFWRNMGALALLTILFTLFALSVAGKVHAKSDRSWLVQAFHCIQKYETGAAWTGQWKANTGNGYFGGLQMDKTFQLTYGPEFVRRYGWANNWPVSIQIQVAIRAWQTRGFGPWPNTRKSCGL